MIFTGNLEYGDYDTRPTYDYYLNYWVYPTKNCWISLPEDFGHSFHSLLKDLVNKAVNCVLQIPGLSFY